MSLAELMGSLLALIARLVTGAQGHWNGCPPKAEQRIYFANHQSHFDWVLIWAALPRELRAQTRPIAARDYWTRTPFKTWLTRQVFHAVYVSRSRARGADAQDSRASEDPDGIDTTGAAGAQGGEDHDPLEPLFEALANGDSLVIFPEGTRSHKGEPMPFKAGLFHLAQRFPQVALIPAWIDNVQRVMPKGEVVPVPILCSVTFGAPLARAGGEDRREFLERARACVLALRPGTD